MNRMTLLNFLASVPEQQTFLFRRAERLLLINGVEGGGEDVGNELHVRRLIAT